MFASRRRTPVTCTHCGVKLERVLPRPSYYTLSFLVAILAEPAGIALLVLVLFQKWWWVAGILLTFLLLNFGVSAFLNSRTRVEFADPKDARQDRPGRWYPQ